MIQTYKVAREIVIFKVLAVKHNTNMNISFFQLYTLLHKLKCSA
jgi:hypothetical protein